MGISLDELARLFGEPRLQQRPLRVLDIGSQNLHGALASEIVAFVRAHHDVYPADELENYARLLSLGAGVHPQFGGLNGAWLGDLLERIGVEYLAYDIFDGYRTTIFDLNVEDLPEARRGTFDLVVNCGTTEHVLNQLNSFRVIHDATKVGGLIYHALPMTGFLDHGYFNYNPRLFLELAEANRYVVRRLTYNGPHGADSMLDKLVRAYKGRIEIDRGAELATEWRDHRVPTASLSVLVEKTREAPFRVALELSTTVGRVPAQIGLSEPEQALMTEMDGQEQRMLEDYTVLGVRPQASQVSALAVKFMDLTASRRVAPLLERLSLQDYLAADPTRDDLRVRLRQLDDMETASQPLVRFDCPTGEIDDLLIKMDGVEHAILDLPAGEQRFRHALAAYLRYAAGGRAEEFPLDAEAYLLEEAIQRRPEDFDLRTRLGRVLTELIPRLPLRPLAAG